MEEKAKTKKEYNTKVINQSKVRELTFGFKVTTEYLDKLDTMVEQMVKESLLRASGNRRTTLMRRDL